MLLPFAVGDVLRGGDFGELDIVATTAGVLLSLLGWLPRRAVRIALAGYLAGAVAYGCLLGGELLLRALAGPQRSRDWRAGLVGVFRAAEPHSYELVPGWRGSFDDGVVRCEIAIDERGNRDEPGPAACERRVLLFGDSFAFGLALAAAHRIDARIEERSAGRFDVVNLGVPGYGPWDAVERFDRCGLRGDDVVYMLFTNDLRSDNAGPGQHTAVAGAIATRTDEHGRLRTWSAAEAAAMVAQLRAWSPSLLETTKATLRLEQVRARIASLVDPESLRLEGRKALYRPEGIDSVVAAVSAFAAKARSAGMGFTVVATPTVGEVHLRGHCAPMVECTLRLRAAGITVHELLPELVTGDYLVHDGHFTPDGADKVAGAMLRWLDARAGGSAVAP
ncbi:MAG: hypothetical protein WAT39_06255, partial [Planctomycetota bacterium]